MTEQDSKITHKTPAPNCPACQEYRRHTLEERIFHPFMGHGYAPETGWTHPLLRAAHEDEQRAFERASKQSLTS